MSLLKKIPNGFYNVDDTTAGINYANAVVPTPSVSFSYDPYFLRPTAMMDQFGLTSWTYKPLGMLGALQVDTEDAPFANDAMSYNYDPVGRISSLTIPSAGAETFTYDPVGRLSTHGTALGTFNYSYLGNSGQVTNRTVTNGTRTLATTMAYGTNANDRRLASISHTGAARSYGLTTNPYQITKITDTASAGHPLSSQTKTFTYDGSDRLLSATTTATGNSTYTYDKLDNITKRVEGGVTNNPTYNNLNQLTQFSGTAWSYDANGNVVSDTKRNYLWDAEDRTTQLTFAGNSNRMSYLYDGLGRRVKGISTVNGVTTESRYLWCGSRLCQTRNSVDTVTSRIYGEGEYQSAGAKKYVYLTDQLGSVRDVVDAGTGALVGSLDYSPYGQVQRKSGSVSPQIQYGQLPWDNNAGLSVSTTRFYDASVARWMSRDPIGEAGGINLYGYVGGSPSLGVDPEGQLPLLIPLAGAAAAELAPYVMIGVGAAGLIWNNALPPATPVPVPIYPAKPSSTPSPSPSASPTTGTAGSQKSCNSRTKKVEPNKDAIGAHTTWKTDPQTGEITRHETWEPNPRNPNGWDSVQSTDMKGRPHVNKQTGDVIPTPHTQGKNIPGGVRPADPSEIHKVIIITTEVWL